MVRFNVERVANRPLSEFGWIICTVVVMALKFALDPNCDRFCFDGKKGHQREAEYSPNKQACFMCAVTAHSRLIDL